MIEPTETETLLDDNYPVYGDYVYLVSADGKWRAVRSDVFGTVRDLRRCLIQRGEKADAVRRCGGHRFC